jgi:hypothetical protein
MNDRRWQGAVVLLCDDFSRGWDDWWLVTGTAPEIERLSFPQRLKPLWWRRSTARLKSCPPGYDVEFDLGSGKTRDLGNDRGCRVATITCEKDGGKLRHSDRWDRLSTFDLADMGRSSAAPLQNPAGARSSSTPTAKVSWRRCRRGALPPGTERGRGFWRRRRG